MNTVGFCKLHSSCTSAITSRNWANNSRHWKAD